MFVCNMFWKLVHAFLILAKSCILKFIASVAQCVDFSTCRINVQQDYNKLIYMYSGIKKYIFLVYFQLPPLRP
jgi:hypothetical protein